jgi:hypothetical protein
MGAAQGDIILRDKKTYNLQLESVALLHLPGLSFEDPNSRSIIHPKLNDAGDVTAGE